MTEQLVADAVVKRLKEWGVGRIFGYSGDGINSFMEALNRSESGPEFVQARHEENAALMAVGHAKYAGGVGVVKRGRAYGRWVWPRARMCRSLAIVSLANVSLSSGSSSLGTVLPPQHGPTEDEQPASDAPV